MLRVKIIQPGNGSEYKSLVNYFKDKGIVHRTTCPYTSEQNDIAERKHRHIVESGLTLLAQASLPLKFWLESFNTAVYLINRMPTKVLKDLYLLEKLYNIKPKYHSLKMFGCLCFHV